MMLGIFDVAPPSNFAQGPGTPTSSVHRMRVQLQDNTTIRGHTFGILHTANASTGVTKLHIRNRMYELYQDAPIRAGWFPSKLFPNLWSAIVHISQKLDNYPPGGTRTSGNIERVTFSDRGIQYRVALENLFGHNLRS